MSRRARAQFVLRGLFSVGLIALLVSRVHWRDLGALLREAHPAPLAVGVLGFGVSPFLIAARTRLWLGRWEVRLPYRPVLSLTWLGQFCNTFLPGSTGGDAVKFLRLCRIVPGRKAATLAALVADRLTALVALGLLAAGALAFGDPQVRRQISLGIASRFHPLFLAAGGGLLLAAGLAGWFLVRRNATRLGPLAARLRVALFSLRAGWRPGPAVGAALGLALTVHLLTLGSSLLFCRALQIPASVGQIMLVVPLTMAAVMLPLTVNGHGLREYVLLFYFGRWHLVSTLPGAGGLTESVVALSLLLVMSDFCWSLPGGLCLLGKLDSAPPAGPAHEPPPQDDRATERVALLRS